MAPAATQSPVASAAETKPVKVEKESFAVKPPTKQGSASLGHVGSDVPVDEELPEVLTNHREPLKLSGALDRFESFDVTPIIGREFVDANLADILRAPNSDDLIRDLAITSKLVDILIIGMFTNKDQSPNAVLSSSVSKTTSPMTSKRSLSSASVSSQASPQLQDCTFILS